MLLQSCFNLKSSVPWVLPTMTSCKDEILQEFWLISKTLQIAFLPRRKFENDTFVLGNFENDAFILRKAVGKSFFESCGRGRKRVTGELKRSTAEIG